MQYTVFVDFYPWQGNCIVMKMVLAIVTERGRERERERGGESDRERERVAGRERELSLSLRSPAETVCRLLVFP